MSDEARGQVSFWEAFRYWLKLGFISFGGPAGQIAVMHTELVEKRRWISEYRFLHALNYCMVLPGPEAQQLATYIGWLLHGTWGGLVAGALFVIPSIFILLTLSWIYMAWGEVPAIAGIFYGIKPAVVAIVLHAAYRIGSRAITNAAPLAIAAAAFVALQLHVPFPAIVVAAGLLGLLGSRIWSKRFVLQESHGGKTALIDAPAEAPTHTRFSRARMGRYLLVSLCCWAVPFTLLSFWQGEGGTFREMAWFFTKAALVTFGGAYAVLPYVTQNAVQYYRWLTTSQMIDGLALGETTPGPLIMVVAFVGFVGGWQVSGLGVPGAILGGLVATYFTFLPSFLFIFLGAPLIETTHGKLAFTAPLTGITAAVVGVILNLALFFGRAVLLPEGGDFQWFAALLTAAALGVLWRLKWGIIPVVLTSGAIGMIASLLFR